jgi:hypothetical protein
MTAIAIRKKLIDFLSEADDKKVKAVYALFEDEIEHASSFSLSAKQFALVEERRKRHKSGLDESVSWKKVHAGIRSKKKVK